MSHFSKKHIAEPVRICVRLKSLREAQKISLTEMVQRTKLQKDAILAIESCAFHKLPSGEIYQKLFIKRYLLALDIDPTPYLKQFEYEELHIKESTLAPLQKKKTHLSAIQNLPSIAKALGISATAFFICIYLGFQMFHLLEAPSLVLGSPIDGIVSTEALVTVEGHTEPEVTVKINGESIMSNQTGVFATDLNLQPGLNTILITAEKKHGQQTSITRHIIYREPTHVSFTGETSELTVD